jgi:hypothetical protein
MKLMANLAGMAARAALPLAAAAALALPLAASLASCATPSLLPEASATIVSSRGGSKDGEAFASVVIRIDVKGSIPAARYGLTVKAASDRRDYWNTEILSDSIPPGKSVVVTMKLPFDTAGEVYKDGSAVIDCAWFE